MTMWALAAQLPAQDAVEAGPAPRSSSFSAADIEFFEKRVRPVLVENCHRCHSREAETLQGGLRLDSRSGLLKGGDSGPSVIPGEPTLSLLIKAVRYDDYEMPPDGQLPPRTIADLEHWVAAGAPWPEETESLTDAGGDHQDVGLDKIAAGRRFWSFQPVSQPPLPTVSDASWPRTRLDYFVLSKLEDRGLSPSQPAARRTLIRRLCFDLLGLPPRPEEVAAFVKAESTTAYEDLVDRLLASPRYGERWARYWLDVARYAEDHPNGALPPRYPHRYRDWVIEALNHDLPYDDFIRRQLAADLLPELALEQRAALGFLGLSPDYVIDEKFSKEVVETILADEWDERVDAISRGLMGLTVACARCHDHKFDPISMKDYYALAGVMASTQLVEWPTVSLDEEDAQRIAGLTEDLRFHEKRYTSRYSQRLGLIKNQEPDIYRYDKEILESASEIQRIRSLLPEDYDSLPRVNAVRDAAARVNPEFYVIRELVSPEARFWRHVEYEHGKARNLPIHIRGSVTKLGEVVPRRFLEVLTEGEPSPFQSGSGRKELAEAILNDAQALTGRVMVNRVWGWHFGQHIVRTPSNFGELGDRPTHPELLQDLTARFLENGWSLKDLHREIVLSATYRQSSALERAKHAADPSNAYLWRMNRRRLDVEAWRDAMLMVTGDLSGQIGGPSFDLDQAENRRRTVYGKVSRSNLADIHKLFDFPEMTRHSQMRTITTTALQQLYYLNSSFMLLRSEAACRQLDSANAEVEQVAELYRQILGRPPTESEKVAARNIVTAGEGVITDGWVMLAQALLASNEFLFVD